MLKLKRKLELDQVVTSQNVAELLDEQSLVSIGGHVLEQFNADEESRFKWDNKIKKVLKQANMEKTFNKNFPIENASNIKYPMITVAAMQFAARAKPQIIVNGKVVGTTVLGEDLDGAKERRGSRISKHMNYQLLIADTEFEEGLDRMLHMLPIVGTVFKKTYFDPVKQKNVSELCLHDEIFIHNNAKSVEDAESITHKIDVSRNFLIENMRSGSFINLKPEEIEAELELRDISDEKFELLEQHTFLDLDGDHYSEPYIVTVLKNSMKVLRIVPRFVDTSIISNEENEIIKIEPLQFFTAYHFLHSFDGTFWGQSFGMLLLDLNEAVDSMYNQLVDAGKLANTQTGFLGRGIRIKSGELRVRSGFYKRLDTGGVDDIRKQIMNLDFKEPSNVTFQLLGLALDASKEITSLNDAMLGREHVQNVPATSMLSAVEQGQKIYSSIQNRFLRSLKQEITKLFKLNQIFLDPNEYIKVLDDPEANAESDYETESLDIIPVADPTLSSDAQKLLRYDMMSQDVQAHPGLHNRYELLRRKYEDLGVRNVDAVLPPPDPNAPPPLEERQFQAEVLRDQAKVFDDTRDKDLRERDVEVRELTASSKATTEMIDAITKAVSAGVKLELDKIKAEVEALTHNVKVRDPDTNEKNAIPEEKINEIRGISEVEGGSGNTDLV